MFPFKSLFASAALIGIAGCSSNPATIANVNPFRSNSGPFDSDVGPFGFDIVSSTSPLERYNYCKIFDSPYTYKLDSRYTYKFDSPYIYKCSTAPNPHPDIDHYVLIYNTTLSQWVIMGVGKNIEDTESAEAKLNELLKQVQSKYSGPWVKGSGPWVKGTNGASNDNPEHESQKVVAVQVVLDYDSSIRISFAGHPKLP